MFAPGAATILSEFAIDRDVVLVVISIVAWPIIGGLWRRYRRRFDKSIDRDLALAHDVSCDERVERATYFSEQRLLHDRNMYLGIAWFLWFADINTHGRLTVPWLIAGAGFYVASLVKGVRANILRDMLAGKWARVSAAEIQQARRFMPPE